MILTQPYITSQSEATVEGLRFSSALILIILQAPSSASSHKGGIRVYASFYQGFIVRREGLGTTKKRLGKKQET